MAAVTTTPAPVHINALSMIWHILYGLVDNLTQTVGLSPVELVGGLLGLVLLVIVVQLVLVSRGHQGWHVDDVRVEIAAAMLAELNGSADSLNSNGAGPSTRIKGW